MHFRSKETKDDKTLRCASHNVDKRKPSDAPWILKMSEPSIRIVKLKLNEITVKH